MGEAERRLEPRSAAVSPVRRPAGALTNVQRGTSNPPIIEPSSQLLCHAQGWRHAVGFAPSPPRSLGPEDRLCQAHQFPSLPRAHPLLVPGAGSQSRLDSDAPGQGVAHDLRSLSYHDGPPAARDWNLPDTGVGQQQGQREGCGWSLVHHHQLELGPPVLMSQESGSDAVSCSGLSSAWLGGKAFKVFPLPELRIKF
nr:uncharacterized protein LOC108403063 isoform X2 [Manis javanica]